MPTFFENTQDSMTGSVCEVVEDDVEDVQDVESCSDDSFSFSGLLYLIAIFRQ